MSLLRRTLSCLKPYWGHIVVSSVSAAFHAFAAGLLIWMAGPLLMTLFQTASPPTPVNPQINNEQEVVVQQSKDVNGSITDKLQNELDFLATLKNRIKDKINDYVGGNHEKKR